MSASAAAQSPTVSPFLMFEGRAEEAITLYASTFDDAQVHEIERYGPEGPGAEGTVARARLTLGGLTLTCIDSPIEHAFSFTPSVSLFVACPDTAQVDRLFEALSRDGEVLMPLDAYPFSERFAWINDRFGVSWQLALAAGTAHG